jgi:hypothetical protein
MASRHFRQFFTRKWPDSQGNSVKMGKVAKIWQKNLNSGNFYSEVLSRVHPAQNHRSLRQMLERYDEAGSSVKAARLHG